MTRSELQDTRIPGAGRAAIVTCTLAAAIGLGAKVALGVTLNEEIITPVYDYHVQYYDKDNSQTDWFVPDAAAQTVADVFDRTGTSSEGNPLGAHVGLTKLGFPDPHFTVEAGYDRDIRLEADDNPNSTSSRIVIPPDWITSLGPSSPGIQQICVHELFHNVQYEYVGDGLFFLSLAPFATESTATAMMDTIFEYSDGAEKDQDSQWMGWALGYLSYYYGLYLWEPGVDGDGYHAAIFWRYLMDQFGVDRTEPHTGHDVIQEFWELEDANELGTVSTIQDVLDAKNRYTTAATDTGVSLDEVFQDFTIANWVRRYVNPWTTGYSLTVKDPKRFYHLDENTEPTAFYSYVRPVVNDPSYDVPEAASSFTLTPGSRTALQTDSACKMAAKYLECSFSNVAPGPEGYGAGFWAESASGEACWYSLIGIRDSGAIDLVEKGSVDPDSGNTFQFATMQSASDPYVQFVAVVTGFAGESSGGLTDLTPEFSYYFGYFQPTLEIREPNAEYLAYVGDFAAPDRFLVKLEVSSPDYLGSGSVKGLAPEQFTVFVGNASDPGNEAKVIAAAEVLGEYWLTVVPPAKTAKPTSPLSLTVYLGSVVDVEEVAVLYEFLEVDQMLVIDRSGSMGWTSGGVPRIEAARAAAQLYVETSGSDDQIGVVRFSGDQNEPDATAYGDGEVIYPLATMNTQFERDLVNLLIDEENPGGDLLDPSGWTSIGDGLYWGAKEIIDSGNPDAEQWIVLLSDGHQNEASDFDAQEALLTATGIHVESIALGDGCDEGLLQMIATKTSGKYYKVEAVTDSAASAAREASSSATDVNQMIFSLADTYLLAAEDIQRRSRLLEASGNLGGGDSRTVELAIDEGGLESAVFALFYDPPSTEMALSITDPGGAAVPIPPRGSPGWDPDRYVVYRLPHLPKGTWTLEIANTGAETINYLLVVSAKNRQGAHADLYFTQYHGDTAAYSQNGLFLVGLPMPITLVLTDSQGPILGADVLATVKHPDKAPVVLRLRDNGGGYDGAAGDGVYSAAYTPTTEASGSGAQPAEETPLSLFGSYKVEVTVRGRDNLGRQFERLERGSFQVHSGQEGVAQDSDGDGMPDLYEELHDCLDETVADADGDPDGDGLKSGSEYDTGTDPCALDTDGGGETDGSELSFGSNPFDWADDAVMQPAIAGVFDTPTDALVGIDLLASQKNVIRFSVERGYHRLNLYRTDNLASPFALVAEIDAAASDGVYEDTGLVNGTTYYYYIEAEDASGRTSVPSRVFQGTPREDPIPPQGTLFINDGDLVTDSTSVDLHIVASADTTEMMIANSRDLTGASWIPFSDQISGHSLGSPADRETVTVYVLLRDAAGNDRLIWDSIIYRAPGLPGVILGTVVAPLDSVNAGCLLRLECPTQMERSTPPSGRFRMLVDPGEYVVRLRMRGYEPVDFSRMFVVAGATVDLGTIELVPIDRDFDGLFDVEELRRYETRPDNPDTDGDGYTDGEEVRVTRTDPTDAASLLRILEIVAQPIDGLVRVIWTSREGVVYQVLGAEGPEVVEWTTLDTVPARTGEPATFYTDPASAILPRRSYRIAVAP